MNDYEKILKILHNLQFLAIESIDPNLQYNVGELRKLLDKFVLWKKENIKFQSSLEPGPAAFQYTLKVWADIEHKMIINSDVINNDWKKTILPELKDYLIKHIDYNLRCSEEENKEK